jgi:hypothetical protein
MGSRGAPLPPPVTGRVRPVSAAHIRKTDRKIANMHSAGKLYWGKTTFASFILKWSRMTVLEYMKKYSRKLNRIGKSSSRK